MPRSSPPTRTSDGGQSSPPSPPARGPRHEALCLAPVLLRERTAAAHAALDATVGPLTTRAVYARYLRGIHAFRAAAEPLLATAPWRPKSLAAASWCRLGRPRPLAARRCFAGSARGRLLGSLVLPTCSKAPPSERGSSIPRHAPSGWAPTTAPGISRSRPATATPGGRSAAHSTPPRPLIPTPRRRPLPPPSTPPARPSPSCRLNPSISPIATASRSTSPARPAAWLPARLRHRRPPSPAAFRQPAGDARRCRPDQRPAAGVAPRRARRCTTCATR